MTNKEYLFTIDEHGTLRINPNYEINPADLAALNAILEAISRKPQELEDLKKQNAELKEQLNQEREARHQLELEHRDAEVANLQKRLEALASRPATPTQSELEVIKSLLDIRAPSTPAKTEMDVISDLVSKLSGRVDEAKKELLGLIKQNPPPLHRENTLPEIAQQFMDVLTQYDYSEGQARTITNHILMVSGEEAFMDKDKLAECLDLFPHIGSPFIRKAILDYWSAKMKLPGDDGEAGVGAKKKK